MSTIEPRWLKAFQNEKMSIKLSAPMWLKVGEPVSYSSGEKCAYLHWQLKYSSAVMWALVCAASWHTHFKNTETGKQMPLIQLQTCDDTCAVFGLWDVTNGLSLNSVALLACSDAKTERRFPPCSGTLLQEPFYLSLRSNVITGGERPVKMTKNPKQF